MTPERGRVLRRPSSNRVPAVDAVRLKIAGWDDVEKMAGVQRGKVVLIDIWTTTCLTCVAEFPKFVELQRKYGSEKVICISVNCDYDGIATKPPEYYRDGVLEFLRLHRAQFKNVLLHVPFIDFLDKLELSSTPAILVYGPDGKLARRFDNDNALSETDEYHIDDVSKLIDQLLAHNRVSVE